MNELRASIPGWIIEYVMLDSDQVHTDSRKVAAQYGKRHADVMRSIRAIVETAEDRRNFALISLADEYGRMQPAYRLTRDGFMQLALGFTGAKAIRLRAQFVEAFGWMAREMWLRRADDHQKRDLLSKAEASIGSRLLHERRRQKPSLELEELQIKQHLQPTLPFGDAP